MTTDLYPLELLAQPSSGLFAMLNYQSLSWDHTDKIGIADSDWRLGLRYCDCDWNWHWRFGLGIGIRD